jgi:hypothetical protein
LAFQTQEKLDQRLLVISAALISLFKREFNSLILPSTFLSMSAEVAQAASQHQAKFITQC